jgi:poly(hydroxyalkanoate) depolymerase family esterase
VPGARLIQAGGAAGAWFEGLFRSEHGSRTYRLYVPRAVAVHRGRVPLVLLLHGCSQSPEDFATGTGMNALAEGATPFLALYPAQNEAANWHACWNWFDPAHQQRDRGEPALLTELTRHVMHHYGADPGRVYVAGMSAGGAMAAILGVTHPDLYAAVGVHSGLPYQAATGLFSAWWAMHFGAGERGGSPASPPGRLVPLIAFHGDCDTQVNVINAHQLVAGWAHSSADALPTLPSPVLEGGVPDGLAYTCSIYRVDGHTVMEKWIVHGLGHAWSGGTGAGSHTDRHGPAASEQMLRFFLARRSRRSWSVSGVAASKASGVHAMTRSSGVVHR